MLQSADIPALQEFVPKFADQLSQAPGFRDVTTDLLIRAPQAYVDIDRERAAALGVSADAIRDTLYSAFGARQVASIFTPTDDFAVILEAGENYQQNINALSQIYVRSVSGTLVPLTSVANVKRSAGPITINHSQLIPAVTVSFNLAPGVSLGDAVSRIRMSRPPRRSLPPRSAAHSRARRRSSRIRSRARASCCWPRFS